jgi:hypothetical protein
VKDRVNPDFSIGLEFEDKKFHLDRVFDNVHIFEWLGYGVMKIVTNTGFVQMGCFIDDALETAEMAGIKPLYRDEISESEYEQYEEFVIKTLDDDQVL